MQCECQRLDDEIVTFFEYLSQHAQKLAEDHSFTKEENQKFTAVMQEAGQLFDKHKQIILQGLSDKELKQEYDLFLQYIVPCVFNILKPEWEMTIKGIKIKD